MSNVAGRLRVAMVGGASGIESGRNALTIVGDGQSHGSLAQYDKNGLSDVVRCAGRVVRDLAVRVPSADTATFIVHSQIPNDAERDN